MNSRRFILFAAGLALSLGQAAAQETNSAPASVAIGLEGQHMVVLPGDKFEAAPVGDKSKLILRIQDVFPHGNAHRYDLRYFGFVDEPEIAKVVAVGIAVREHVLNA